MAAPSLTSKSATLFIATAPTSPRRIRGSTGPRETARKGEAGSRAGIPASPRASQPSAVLLTPGVPDRPERRERRVQAEEAVQVEGRIGHARGRAGDRDVAARGIVVGVAVRDDHAEAVHRAPLEDGDQDLRPGRAPLREGRAHEESGRPAQREQGERPALHERSPRAARHGYRRWNSGEPRTSAASFSTSVSLAT